MRQLLVGIFFVVAASVGACFDKPEPACALLCGGDGSCPDGYSCRGDGWCKRDDVADDLVCEIDASASQDAPAVDAALDGGS